MVHRMVVAVAAACLAACSAQRSGDSPTMDPASSGQVWPWEYRAQLAADLEAHRAAMAEPWPVEATASTCEGDCFLGVMVAGSLYAVSGPVTLTALQRGDLVADYDGSEIYAIDGLDPALYLVMDSAEGPQLLEYWEVPFEATSREAAVRDKAARCAVTTIATRNEVFVGICDDPNVIWYSTEWAPSWLTDHLELRVGDPSVLHVEAAASVIDQAEAARADGVPTASVLAHTELGSIAVETFPSVDDALAALLEQVCATGKPCRSGYRIERRTPDEVSVTFTNQQTDPTSANGVLVGYSTLTLTRARPTVWWVSARGPAGGYDNADGSATREEADRLFAACCDVTVGQL